MGAPTIVLDMILHHTDGITRGKNYDKAKRERQLRHAMNLWAGRLTEMSRGLSGLPRRSCQAAKLSCGSRSMRATRDRPFDARTARAVDNVVLPTPPFVAASVMMFVTFFFDTDLPLATCSYLELDLI